MWLFTTLGFYSIVRKDADEVHIRARCRDDLETLVEAIDRASAPSSPSAAGNCEPSFGICHAAFVILPSHPGSDYPWRIIVRASIDLELVMSVLAASIDYSNFKSAIAASPAQCSKAHAYHDIHRRMLEWQSAGCTPHPGLRF